MDIASHIDHGLHLLTGHAHLFICRSEHYFGTEAFKMVDMAEYGDSYRRLFFETYLQDRICNFVPLSDDFGKLLEDVSMGGKYAIVCVVD